MANRLVTKNKVRKISDNLLHYRTLLILHKHLTEQKEDSVQKYLAEQEFKACDEFISNLEMEYRMYKYISSYRVKDDML